LVFASICTVFTADAQSKLAQHTYQDHSPPKEKILKVYPIPATTQITFQLQGNNEGTYEIIVYNFLGKKVDELKGIQSSQTLSLDDYYSGIYIYQLRSKKGNLIESGKFNVVKQ
jgi:hypothetical protein